MRHFHHFFGHGHVVIKIRRCLAVFAQRTVHHDRAKTQIQRALADSGAGAVVLVHDHRDVWISLRCGLNQILDEMLARIFARTCAGLQNHGRTHFIGSGHDGLHLFQVIHIEGGNAIAVFGSMVEQLAHGDESHVVVLFLR